MTAGRFDYAIIGGGCAGLSLASTLAKRLETNQRLVIVEPRTQYQRDRTWCYWNVKPHDFTQTVSHRWQHWLVRYQGKEIVRSSQRYEYHHIPADRFYRSALDRLTKCANVDLRLGSTVCDLSEQQGHIAVSTTNGELHCGCVFDSRPPKLRADGHIKLKQHFVGYIVRANENVFDPNVITLMDFDVPQSHGIHFFYVLPYSPVEALVEATFISTQELSKSSYEDAISRYLRKRYKLRLFQILETETGAIPMSTVAFPRHPLRNGYYIGTAAGAVKASTGYAFLNIQSWVRDMTDRLEHSNEPAPPAARPWWSLTLDRIFLAYLQRYPERAPKLFVSLFAKVEPDRLIRFLSDVASPSDIFAVMAAMPIGPFLRESVRSSRLWLRP